MVFDTGDFSWHDHMRQILEKHKDVRILSCGADDVTNSDANDVTGGSNSFSCWASSILLSAYSQVLREAFNIDDDEVSVISMQDFSGESIQALLDFLANGKSIDINDEKLALEIDSLCRTLRIKGFTIDGLQRPKLLVESAGGENEALTKLAKVKGLNVTLAPVPVCDTKVKDESDLCFTKIVDSEPTTSKRTLNPSSKAVKGKPKTLLTKKASLKKLSMLEGINVQMVRVQPTRPVKLEIPVQVYSDLDSGGSDFDPSVGAAIYSDSEYEVDEEIGATLKSMRSRNKADSDPDFEVNVEERRKSRQSKSKTKRIKYCSDSDDSGDNSDPDYQVKARSKKSSKPKKTKSKTKPDTYEKDFEFGNMSEPAEEYNANGVNGEDLIDMDGESESNKKSKGSKRKRVSDEEDPDFEMGRNKTKVSSNGVSSESTAKKKSKKKAVEPVCSDSDFEEMMEEIIGVKKSGYWEKVNKVVHVKPVLTLKCSLCDQILASPKALDIHLQNHVKSELCMERISQVDEMVPLYRPDLFLGQDVKQVAWGDYQCDFCGQAFETLQNKADHLVDHHASAVAQNRFCRACDEEFESVETYFKHCRAHGNTCYLCGTVVKHYRGYVTHLMTHIDQCLRPEVKLDFNNPPALPRVVNDPDSEGHFFCPYCGLKYLALSDLLVHMKPHAVEAFNRTTFCRTCEREFESVGQYFEHLSVHAESAKFPCPLCDKKLNLNRELKQHVKDCKKAAKQEEYICDQCGFTTLKYDTFQHHMRVHNGTVKKYACKECDKQLQSPFALEEHVNAVHRGIMPYMCDVCGAGFLRKGKMIMHKSAVHENLALYKCGVCGEKFKMRTVIDKHIGLHLETPLHRCTVCLMQFKCAATGYIHIKKVHGLGQAKLKKEVTEELKQLRKTAIISIKPEKVSETPRRQTRPLAKIN